MLLPPVRVCFVCSGNICRSPTAEVALTRLAARSGRPHLIVADSAGTGAWHVGDDMDERSRRTMSQAGWDVPRHVAKQFEPATFATRDLVVALDRGHYNVLWWLAAETPDADGARAKIVMLRAFDPELQPDESPEVGDPYYGGNGFSVVLEQVERSCAALLDAIERAVTTGGDVAPPAAVQQDESPPR